VLSAQAKLLDGLIDGKDRPSVAATQQAISKLHSLLNSGNLDVAGKFLISVANLAKAATYPRFGSSCRGQALEIMRRIAPRESIAELKKMWEWADEGSPLESTSVYALARLGTKESVWPLVNGVDRLTPAQKQSCINGLRSAGTPCAQEALEAIQANDQSNPNPAKAPGSAAKARPTRLNWTVLPQGWWSDPKYQSQVAKINSKTKNPGIILERLAYLESLGPRLAYEGKDRLGSEAYWVFVFDRHVVAECPLWGNAIYVIRGTGDWRTLLSKSKRELLTAGQGRIQRISHKGDWKSRLVLELKK
jgi:hypothetical protein